MQLKKFQIYLNALELLGEGTEKEKELRQRINSFFDKTKTLVEAYRKLVESNYEDFAVEEFSSLTESLEGLNTETQKIKSFTIEIQKDIDSYIETYTSKEILLNFMQETIYRYMKNGRK